MRRALSLGVRTYARYAIPLTLLSLLAFAPLLLVPTRILAPANAAHARELVRAQWELIALASVWLLALTGAAAPLARSLVATAPLGQLPALRAGLRGVVGAMLPVLGALVAIGVGLAALVIPGLILVPLLVYAGACTSRGIAARLAESASVARAHLSTAVGVLALVVVVIAVSVVVLYLTLPIPVPKKPSLTDLRAFDSTILMVGIGCALLAPVLASLLAAVPALHAPADSAEVDR